MSMDCLPHLGHGKSFPYCVAANSSINSLGPFIGKVILWTCRVDDRLEAALAWCAEQGLVFDAVNDNLPELIEKYSSNCRKVCADRYIDDKAIGPFELDMLHGLLYSRPAE